METLLERFLICTGIDPMYRNYFRRGMYLAQNPTSLEYRREDDLSLSAEENKYIKEDQQESLSLLNKERLKRWLSGRWNQPSSLTRLVMLCAVGAAVQGWDESAVNSAQLYYQDAYGIWIYSPSGPKEQPWNLAAQPWKVGLVNSAPYLCCVFSCWLTYPLNKVFGRRWTIFISCLFSAVFALAQSFAMSWEVMTVLRILMGLGIGPKSATIPIYAAEAAPPNIRGQLVMMWQVWTAFGIMCGYLSGIAFHGVLGDDTGTVDPDQGIQSALLGVNCSLKWRLMIGSPCVAPCIVLLYIFTQPESPRWLIARGHGNYQPVDDNPERNAYAQRCYREAFETFLRLRHTKLQAARDMFLVYHQLNDERREVKDRNEKQHIPFYRKNAFELVSVRRNRRALIASLTCMFAQQFW